MHLMAPDAVGAPARDELGITQGRLRRPPASPSGAAMPLLVAALARDPRMIYSVSGTSLLGASAARAGGADSGFAAMTR